MQYVAVQLLNRTENRNRNWTATQKKKQETESQIEQKSSFLWR